MEKGFNNTLKDIRKSKSITQEQLAEAVGVSAQAVSKWETNGYPDTPLLPKIADFLDVTIDELFGKEKQELSIEDKIIRYFKTVPDDARIQKSMDITRSLFCVFTGGEQYYPVPDYVFNSPDSDIFSCITNNTGWMQSRITERLQYFLLMPEPKNGYDDLLKYDESYVKLFKFLSMHNALRVMYFLAGRSTNTFFTVDAIAKEVNIEQKNAKEIVEKMLELKFVWKANLNSDNGSETIYQYDAGCNFVSFITFAYVLLNQPDTYNYQSNVRGCKPYFKNDTYKFSENGKK